MPPYADPEEDDLDDGDDVDRTPSESVTSYSVPTIRTEPMKVLFPPEDR